MSSSAQVDLADPQLPPLPELHVETLFHSSPPSPKSTTTPPSPRTPPTPFSPHQSHRISSLPTAGGW